jgi:hypothetical protein
MLRKTRKFSLLQMMNLADGRLFTTHNDIAKILSHITGECLFRHQLFIAFCYIELINPKWFESLVEDSKKIDTTVGSDYSTKLKFIKKYHSTTTYNIPTLDEHQKKGLIIYLSEYSQ